MKRGREEFSKAPDFATEQRTQDFVDSDSDKSLEDKVLDKKKVKLQRANALGDDRNLRDHGNNRHYWYSIGDGFRLLLGIRESKLTYAKEDGNLYPIKAIGEEYSATRENRQGILMTDPYHLDNFASSLDDDLKTITGEHTTDIYGVDQTAKNNHWVVMPKIIVIPLLSGQHWRAVRIEIDYEKRSASILFDDPYGGIGFNDSLTLRVLPAIEMAIGRLIPPDMEDSKADITVYKKKFDQQGRGSNGYDCGPVVFSNISDYATTEVTNQQFVESSDYYTVPLADMHDHEYKIVQVRTSDIQVYARTADLSQNIAARIEQIKQFLKESLESRKKELESTADDTTIVRIKALPEEAFVFICEMIENKRLAERPAEYTAEEFRWAYELIADVEHRSELTIEKDSVKLDIVRSSSLEPTGDEEHRLAPAIEKDITELYRAKLDALNKWCYTILKKVKDEDPDKWESIRTSEKDILEILSDNKEFNTLIATIKDEYTIRKVFQSIVEQYDTSLESKLMGVLDAQPFKHDSDKGSDDASYRTSDMSDKSYGEDKDSAIHIRDRSSRQKKLFQQLRQQPQFKHFADKDVMVRLHITSDGSIGVDGDVLKAGDSVQIMGRAAVAGGKGHQMRHVTPVAFVEHMVRNSITSILSEEGNTAKDVLKFFLHNIDSFIEVDDRGTVLKEDEFNALILPKSLKKEFEYLKLSKSTHILVDEETRDKIIAHNSENKGIFDSISDSKHRLEAWHKEKKEIILLNIFETYLSYLDKDLDRVGVEYISQLLITEFNRHKGAAFPTEGNTRDYEVRIYEPKTGPRGGKSEIDRGVVDDITTFNPSTMPASYKIRKVNAEGSGIHGVIETLSKMNKGLLEDLDDEAKMSIAEEVAGALFLAFDYKKLEDFILVESSDGTGFPIYEGVTGRTICYYTPQAGSVVRDIEKGDVDKKYGHDITWRSEEFNPEEAAKLITRHLILTFLAYPNLRKIHEQVTVEFIHLVADNFALGVDDKAALLSKIQKELGGVYPEEVSISGSPHISSSHSGAKFSSPDISSGSGKSGLDSSKSGLDSGEMDHENLKRFEKISLQNTGDNVVFREELYKLQIPQNIEVLDRLVAESERELSSELTTSIERTEYPGQVTLMPEVSHKSQHSSNVEELIKRINSGDISPDTVICLERKQDGNNLGMKDVILLANIIKHNDEKPNQEKIVIPKSIMNSSIYADALLYQAARTKGVLIVGIEGKDLGLSKESPDYNLAREEYMAQRLQDITSSGKNVIFPVGSAHIASLRSKLKAKDIDATVHDKLSQDERDGLVARDVKTDISTRYSVLRELDPASKKHVKAIRQKFTSYKAIIDSPREARETKRNLGKGPGF